MQKIGKYEVLKKLGEGMTGSVFLCRDSFADRDVAVKLVSQNALRVMNNGRILHRLFLTEASLAGKLIHPHIVEIYDATADEDNAYIVMEYVSGGTLQRFTSPDNLLGMGDVIEIVYKCSRALDFASRLGVIHRDIKPENILIRHGTDIKITDFGSAALLLASRTVIDGVGTPAYMAPEQHLNHPLNLQTDIYSLGVVMFQLLTGRLPFGATNIAALAYQMLNQDPPLPSAFRRDIPKSIDAVVRRALERDMNRRYQNWRELSDDLVSAAAGDMPRPKLGLFETEQFNTLRSLSFFRAFSDVELWEVLRFGEWSNAAADEVIMKEGEPGGYFCILTSGQARVMRNGQLIATLEAGECAGEMAYFGEVGRLRTADVAAAGEVTFMRIGIDALERASELCRLHFDRAFLRILVERLTLANSQLTGI